MIFTAIFFELTLRFIGYQEGHKNIARSISHSPQSNQYTILTLGNSYTAGIGAPPGKSYPAKLEKMLNSDGGNSYRVINHGKGNTNTRYIIDNLPRWMEEAPPDLVFVMTGEANAWNQYGLSDFMEERNYAHKRFDLNRYLAWSKVYRLYELFSKGKVGLDQDHKTYSKTFPNLNQSTDYKRTLAYQWLSHLQHGVIFNVGELDQEQSKEATEALLYIEEKDRNPIASLLLADLALLKHNNHDDFFKHAVKSFNYLPNFNFDLWRIVESRKEILRSSKDQIRSNQLKKMLMTKKPLRNLSEIEYWYKTRNLDKFNLPTTKDEVAFVRDMVRMIPSDTMTFLHYLENYRASPEVVAEVEFISSMNPLAVSVNYDKQMSSITVDQKKVREKMELIRLMRNRLAGIEENASLDDELTVEEEWVNSDIDRIIEIVKKQGARVVIQTYPPARNGKLRLADKVMRQNRKKYEGKQVEFQDLGLELKDLFNLKKGGVKFYSGQFGAYDDHQSTLGNVEIAKRMLKYVERFNLASTKPESSGFISPKI